MAIRYIVEINDPVTHRFSSAIRSEYDPSNDTYPDSIGDPIRYPVKLMIPKLNTKLSDSISGSIILGQVPIVIENSDGAYDDVEALEWFNIPVVVKRSNIDQPTLDDFTTIFKGIIDYPIVNQSNVRLITNNKYRALTEEVTETFNIIDYPDIPAQTLDKDIPIGYGTELMMVPLYQIDSTDLTQYIAIDTNYLTAVNAVYDKDGASIAFSVSLGVITATDAVTADVEGRTDDNIMEIITSEIAVKSSILYDSDNWDTVETDSYSTIAGNLNFYFSGGTVRQLVDAVLKSDNAFLFTKNNGLLTIRQWGKAYSTHTIKRWQQMNYTNKSYADAMKNYNSRADIFYSKNQTTGVLGKKISSGTTPAFDKIRVVPYPTDLRDTTQISDLGDRMIKRFGILSEVIKIYAGVSTIDMNLLDEIELDVNWNGRQFSNKTKWIVTEVDPGQDILSLEAKSGFIEDAIIDGVLSQPMYDGADGILSQPYYEDIDGVLSQPMTVTIAD